MKMSKYIKLTFCLLLTVVLMFNVVGCGSGAADMAAIEDMEIDEDNLDKVALEQEIRNRWLELEFESL